MKAVLLTLVLAVSLFAGLVDAQHKCGYQNKMGTFVDLRSIPSTTLYTTAMFQGKNISFTWIFGICELVDHPGDHATTCGANSALFWLFPTGEYCTEVWGVGGIPDWWFNAATGGGSQKFENSNSLLNVNLICGTQKALKAAGEVVMTNSSGKMNYTLTLSTSVVCARNPTPNTTVSQLRCKDSMCSQCTGDVSPIGECVAQGATASQKVVSCSHNGVALDTWSMSSKCSSRSSPSKKTTWPIGKCIHVAPGDYRYFSCSRY